MKIRKAEKRTFQEFLHCWGRYYRYMRRSVRIFYTGYYEIHLRADRAITTGGSSYLCCRRRERSLHGLCILPTQGTALFHEYGPL